MPITTFKKAVVQYGSRRKTYRGRRLGDLMSWAKLEHEVVATEDGFAFQTKEVEIERRLEDYLRGNGAFEPKVVVK